MHEKRTYYDQIGIVRIKAVVIGNVLADYVLDVSDEDEFGRKQRRRYARKLRRLCNLDDALVQAANEKVLANLAAAD